MTWDVRTGSPICHLPVAHWAAFEPTGKLIALGGSDGVISLVESQTGRLQATFKHGGSDAVVAFSPDGKFLASGSSDGDVKLWAVSGASIVLLSELGSHNDGVTEVCFSPNGRLLASISGSSTLKIWDTRTLARLRTFSSELGSDRYAECGGPPYDQAVCFHPSGRRVFYSFTEDAVRVADLGDLPAALTAMPTPSAGPQPNR
jgi:WD40 repeat protein